MSMKWVLLFALMFLFSITPSYAYTYGNLEAYLLRGNSDVPVVLQNHYPQTFYTPACNVDCHLPLLVRWNGATDITLNRGEISFAKQLLFGSDNVYNLKAWYLDNVTFISFRYNHTTGLWTNYTDWRGEWVQFTPTDVTIKKGKWYVIDITGAFNRSEASTVDIVPTVKGITMPDFATWSWTAGFSWTNPAGSCGTAGGGTTLFGINLTTIAGNQSKLLWVDVKATSANTRWVGVFTAPAGLLIINSTNNTTTNFTLNGTWGVELNASTPYMILSYPVTRTSCSPSFPYVATGFNVTHGIYCGSANPTTCNGLTNEIFETSSIGYAMNVTGVSGDPTSTTLYINGGVGNISHAYTTTADNVTGKINITGLPVSITWNGTVKNTTNTNVYYYAILPAGMHNFTANWSGNDTYMLSFATLWANISKATTTCNLTFNASSPLGYENITKATCSCNNPEGSPKLYRNNSDVTAGENNTGIRLGVGTNGYTCNITETANYSTYTTGANFVITAKNANVRVSPTSQTVPYGSNLTYSCMDDSLLACALARNGTVVSNNTYWLLGAAIYNWTANISDQTNYTSYYAGSQLNVTKANPYLNITLNTTNYVVDGAIVNVSCLYPVYNNAVELGAMGLYNDTAFFGSNSTGIITGVFDTTGLAGTTETFSCNSSATANFTAGAATNVTLTITSGNSLLANIYDEETWAAVVADLEIDLYYGAANESFHYNNSFAGLSSYNIALPNTTGAGSVYANGTIKYSNSSYTTRYYYLYNYTVSNVTTTLYLYLSNATSPVQYLVQNEFGIPWNRIQIQSQRYFIDNGTYINVVEGETDVNGYAYMNAVPNTWYKYLLVKNGVTLKTFDAMYLNTSQVILPYTSDLTTNYLRWWSGLSYQAYYNKTTRVLTCTVSDSSGLLTLTELYATKYNFSGSYSLCANSSASSSVTLTCTAPAGNYSMDWACYGTMSGERWILGHGSVQTGGATASRFGNTGLIASWFLITVLFFVGLWNPVVSVVFGVSGLGIAMLTGFISVTENWITALVFIAIAGAVIVYKMRT